MAHLQVTGIAGIVTIIVIVIIVVIIISWLFGRRRSLDILSDGDSDWDENLHDASEHRRHGRQANRQRRQEGRERVVVTGLKSRLRLFQQRLKRLFGVLPNCWRKIFRVQRLWLTPTAELAATWMHC